MRYPGLISALVFSGVMVLGIALSDDFGPYVEPDGQSASLTGGEIGPYVEPDGRSGFSTSGEIGPLIEPDGRA